jgi:hypothetical protein
LRAYLYGVHLEKDQKVLQVFGEVYVQEDEVVIFLGENKGVPEANYVYTELSPSSYMFDRGTLFRVRG